MLALALASSAMPPSAIVPAPGADAFSSSVDAEAGRACHARNGLDLSGDAAYVWGTGFHVENAATCCKACAAHRATCGANGSKGNPVYWDDGKHKLRCGRTRGRCNAFVFCAAADGQCFSYDIHVHKTGECWLKHEPNISMPVAAGPHATAHDARRASTRLAVGRIHQSLAERETSREDHVAVWHRCAARRSHVAGAKGSGMAAVILQEAWVLKARAGDCAAHAVHVHNGTCTCLFHRPCHRHTRYGHGQVHGHGDRSATPVEQQYMRCINQPAAVLAQIACEHRARIGSLLRGLAPLHGANPCRIR